MEAGVVPQLGRLHCEQSNSIGEGNGKVQLSLTDQPTDEFIFSGYSSNAKSFKRQVATGQIGSRGEEVHQGFSWGLDTELDRKGNSLCVKPQHPK